MDKKLLVITIAIGTILISTLLQIFIQGRDLNPKGKRLVWVTFLAGVVALVALFMLVLGR